MLEEVFVGRRDEQARFAALLRRLPSSKRPGVFAQPRGRRSRAATADDSRSSVVLVHGLGGSGKSMLLRQFREMADGKLPDSPVGLGRVRTIWLDWAVEQEDHPANFANMEGPSLVTVLDAVQKKVIDAVGPNKKAAERAKRAFSAYRQAAARMPDYAARFAEVIAQSSKPGSPFTTGDAAVLLKSLSGGILVAAGHPAGVIGLTPDKLAESAQAAAHLSEAAVKAVTGKKTGEISQEEYDLVTDPASELARRIATALRMVAESRPLMVLLDTGEVIGLTAWSWLRQVMTLTGPRVIWVIGARFETEAEAGHDSPITQFVRQIGDAHLSLMAPTRFDDEMIGEYLSIRTDGCHYSGDQIDLIAEYTRGLPLAVSLVAELIEAGQNIDDICQYAEGALPNSIVSLLARRYLIHAETRNYPPDDPRGKDVSKILGLALAFTDPGNDPQLLAALWEVEDPLSVFQDLARRHDFVLPVSRRLHEDVRDILRSDLLDPFRRGRMRAANQRALDLYRQRLVDLRNRWPTLDEQLSSTGFKRGLLSALWHALWIDNQVGFDLFIEVLPILAVAESATANSAVAMIDRFASSFDDDQRYALSLVTVKSNKPSEVHVSHHDTLRIGQWLAQLQAGPTKENLMRNLATGSNAQKRLISSLMIVTSVALPDFSSLVEPFWAMISSPLDPSGRTVMYTMEGITLEPPDMEKRPPLVGDWADRQAAVGIWNALLYAESNEKDAAIASLEIASGQTRSARMLRLVETFSRILNLK